MPSPVDSRQSSVNSFRASVPFCSLDCPFFCWSCPLFPKSYAHLRMVTPFAEGVTPFADGLRSFPRDFQGLRRPTPLPRVGGTLECGLGMNMLLWEVAGDESSRWCRMYALWCPLPKSPTHPAPLSPIPDPRSGIRAQLLFQNAFLLVLQHFVPAWICFHQ